MQIFRNIESVTKVSDSGLKTFVTEKHTHKVDLDSRYITATTHDSIAIIIVHVYTANTMINKLTSK